MHSKDTTKYILRTIFVHSLMHSLMHPTIIFTFNNLNVV